MKAKVPFLDLAAMHADLAKELNEAWRRVSTSAKFVGGEFVDRFEESWAAYCGAKYCVGVSDGTSALELALRALGTCPGDEVIVPANTFIATWEAVIAVGARPVAVDVDPWTLLMTAEAIEVARSKRTVGVIAVHLFGQPANMDLINRTAKRAGLWVVEDAAQAHGATWRGKRVGSLADVGCFSFYPGKNLGAFGDAGAVVTNHAYVADCIRSLANHGRHANAADTREFARVLTQFGRARALDCGRQRQPCRALNCLHERAPHAPRGAVDSNGNHSRPPPRYRSGKRPHGRTRYTRVHARPAPAARDAYRQYVLSSWRFMYI